MLIQIFIVAFASFAVLRLIFKFRKKVLRAGEFVFWMALWTVAAVIAIIPETTNYLAGVLGVGRGADLVMYVSIIALFYAVFRIFVRIEKMERDMTKVVRRMAIEEQKESRE